MYRSKVSDYTGPFVQSVTMRVASGDGGTWSHPIARSLGATFRTVAPQGSLKCRWMQSQSLTYVEMNGSICECLTQPQNPFLRPKGNQRFLVVLQQEGEGRVTWNGTSYPLRRGEWAVLSEDAQYRSTSPIALSVVMLRIVPDERWASRNLHKSFLLRSCTTPDHGAFVRSFLRQLLLSEKGAAEEIYSDLSQALLTLLVYQPEERLNTAPQTAHLADRIRNYVVTHLSDSELSLDQVAMALRCSKRSLHKAFAEQGSSISEFIWTERLQRCKRELEEWPQSRRSITDIALSWGFSSPSHFSTLFKARFHESPRDYRRRHAEVLREVPWKIPPAGSHELTHYCESVA